MTYNVFSGMLNPTHFTSLHLEFNIPFHHKYGYIRDDVTSVEFIHSYSNFYT